MATSQFKFTLRNRSKNAINCVMNDWMLKDLKRKLRPELASSENYISMEKCLKCNEMMTLLKDLNW